jgi:hypothetical protein
MVSTFFPGQKSRFPLSGSDKKAGILYYIVEHLTGRTGVAGIPIWDELYL